jgi:hypothetical protein
VYNQKLSIHYKCAWVGIHQIMKSTQRKRFIINKTDKHNHTHKKRYLEVISRSTRFKEFNREKNSNKNIE